MGNTRVTVNFINEVFSNVLVFSGKSASDRMIHAKFGEGAERRSMLFEVWYLLGIEVNETKKGGNALDRDKSWPKS